MITVSIILEETDKDFRVSVEVNGENVTPDELYVANAIEEYNTEKLQYAMNQAIQYKANLN